MSQMSPMVWVVFPFVMVVFLVMMAVFMYFESGVFKNEDLLESKWKSIKW